MATKLLQADDITGGSFALVLIALVATTVLLIMGTAWAAGRWKLPVALAAMAALVAALHYYYAYDVWLATGQTTIVYRYIGWFLSMPLQVVTLYFFIGATGRLPVGLFWRLLVAAILMVLARYLGEAGLMHPTLGFLIGLAFWLYILGEVFFGRMSEINDKTPSEPTRRGFFWLRLIVTIGWAIYPLCYFISSFAGGVAADRLSIVYNLADFINQIAFGLTILTVAVLDSGSMLE